MIYSININTLKAAQFCSATKDVRYYLNSVYLDFKIDTVTPHVNIIATDGHVLAAYNDKLPIENRGDDGDDFSLIVPLDTIKAVLKMVGKNQKTVELEKTGENWRLGDLNFSPIDGKYPEYTRVIPATEKRHYTGDGPRFDPEILSRAQKSISIRLGYTATAKNKGFMSYGPTKNDSAVLHNGDNLSVVVIMPMKNAENVYYGFTV
tara:strand:- start:334 stop:951 length:618 start_codon:yes stop_codon:yes gene_type:complete